MIAKRTVIDSPIGSLTLFVVGDALAGVAFDDYEAEVARWIARSHGVREVRDAADRSGWRGRFERYLAGDMAAFDGGALLTGGTEFQRAVWSALCEIPAGSTISYGELARRIGRADAVRAVGAANGANPIPVDDPCHRVVAAAGSLHGYGGGLPRKRWLLAHEARHAGVQRSLGFSGGR